MRRAVENVWSYPRPPALDREPGVVTVAFGGTQIVRSERALRVLETSHPPTMYIPRADVMEGCLRKVRGKSSVCEWKGVATYYDVVVGDKVAPAAVWAYEDPTEAFKDIADCVSFYPGRMDECTVDGEKVKPQPSDFYGGWMNSWITGGERGVKGPPGTLFW